MAAGGDGSFDGVDRPAGTAEQAAQAAASRGGAVEIHTLVAGDATNYPKAGDTVRLHYETSLQDGTVIDSSRKRKNPFEFRVGRGQVVKGLELAVQKLSRGQKARLVIPAKFAYGARGYPPIIPANADLTMEVELISFA